MSELEAEQRREGAKLLSAGDKWACWPRSQPIFVTGIGPQSPVARILGGNVFDASGSAVYVECRCPKCTPLPALLPRDEDEAADQPSECSRRSLELGSGVWGPSGEGGAAYVCAPVCGGRCGEVGVGRRGGSAPGRVYDGLPPPSPKPNGSDSCECCLRARVHTGCSIHMRCVLRETKLLSCARTALPIAADSFAVTHGTPESFPGLCPCPRVCTCTCSYPYTRAATRPHVNSL